MKSVYLLGVNTKHELIFSKIILKHPTHYDRLKSTYVEEVDKMQLVIVFYAVKPSLSNEKDRRDLVDEVQCGLHLNEALANNKSLYFNACHCGQYDSRIDGMLEYTSEEAYNIIHDLWDKYHLEIVGKDVFKQIGRIINIFAEMDEDYLLDKYIKKYKDKFDGGVTL